MAKGTAIAKATLPEGTNQMDAMTPGILAAILLVLSRRPAPEEPQLRGLRNWGLFPLEGLAEGGLGKHKQIPIA